MPLGARGCIDLRHPRRFEKLLLWRPLAAGPVTFVRKANVGHQLHTIPSVRTTLSPRAGVQGTPPSCGDESLARRLDRARPAGLPQGAVAHAGAIPVESGAAPADRGMRDPSVLVPLPAPPRPAPPGAACRGSCRQRRLLERRGTPPLGWTPQHRFGVSGHRRGHRRVPGGPASGRHNSLGTSRRSCVPPSPRESPACSRHPR